jgi:peptidoglycan/LPS O-acetylase OafA/YrhL
LLEKIPLDAVKTLHLEKHPFLAFPITTVVTYATAMLAWNFVESPVLKLRRFFDKKTISDERTISENGSAERLVELASKRKTLKVLGATQG